MTVKKNLYELLEVRQDASLDEIKASHLRLTRQIMSSKQDLSRDEVEFQLKILDVALQTLSDQVSRDSYDATIAPPLLPQNLSTPGTALTINKSVADSIALTRQPEHDMPIPLHVAEKSLSSTVSSLKKIARIVLILVIAIFILNVFIHSLTSGLKRNVPPSEEMSKAEEKVLLQEYYQTYGVRPASIEEMRLLEAERRREDREQRAADYDAKKKERDYQSFVDESRRMAEDASRDIQRAEERARWEAERKVARDKYEQEVAERRRLEENVRDAEAARRKLGMDSVYSNYNNR